MRERLREAGLQVRHARELVVSKQILNEQVVKMEELVVRADRDRVRAFQPRQVLVDLDDVLIELIGL